MTDYMIVSSEEAEDLETAVKLHMEDGWEPVGGLAISVTNKTSVMDQTVWFMQAMILK